MVTKKTLKKFPWGICLLILIIIYIAVFFGVACLKYSSFSFHDMDLAAINQTFWNAIHGRFISQSYGEAALLSGHRWVIILPLLPLYALIPNPLTLLFLQSLAFGIAAWPIYLLGRDYLKEKFGLLFAFCYLIYPAMNYASLYEFHPLCFATPLLLFIFYFYSKKRWGLFLLFTILSLSVREDVAIPVFGIGLFALLKEFLNKDEIIWSRLKWGIVPLVFSLSWFLICLQIVPALMQRLTPELPVGSAVGSFYSWMGESPFEIIEQVFSHPQLGIIRIQKLTYLQQLFIPLGFVSLLSPSTLIMVAVSLSEGLLSSRFTHFSIRYQYSAIIIPSIFISAIYGLRNLLRPGWLSRKENYIGGIILLSSIGSAYFFGPLFQLPSGIDTWKFTEEDRARQIMADTIPPTAPVVSTFEFAPKLSLRPRLFYFYHIYSSPRKPGFKPHIPDIQKDGKYALIDFNDWLTFYDFFTPTGDQVIYQFLREGNWGVAESVNNLALFKKNYKSRFQIVGKVKNPGIEYPINREVISGVRLLGFNLNQVHWEGMLLLDFSCYMEVTRHFPVGFLLNPRFVLNNDPSISFQQPMFAPYRILPSSRWRPGEIYLQRCRILVPSDLPPGDYGLSLGLMVQKGKGWEGKVIHQQRDVFQHN